MLLGNLISEKGVFTFIGQRKLINMDFEYFYLKKKEVFTSSSFNQNLGRVALAGLTTF